MTLTKEILQEIVERDQREQKARAWLLGGGGGHEDGEDGLRALSLPGAGLVDFLASYEEYLQEKDQAKRKQELRDSYKMQSALLEIKGYADRKELIHPRTIQMLWEQETLADSIDRAASVLTNGN